MWFNLIDSGYWVRFPTEPDFRHYYSQLYCVQFCAWPSTEAYTMHAVVSTVCIDSFVPGSVQKLTPLYVTM
jgi:hypothetical protein